MEIPEINYVIRRCLAIYLHSYINQLESAVPIYNRALLMRNI